MKFNTFTCKEPKHKATVTAVDWSSSEEVYSCSDDHVLLKWNLSVPDSTTVLTFPSDFFPTDLHCCPKVTSGSGVGAVPGKQVLDTIVVCSTDGRFFIVNKSGRIEKKVDAHKAAILSGRWSPDGASILTCGEDGHIRIWSRSGMLRSTVVQENADNMVALWGTQGSSIVHSHGRRIAVKPLTANSKGIKWRAHESTVTCLSFSSTAGEVIVSGAEDGKYRVWNLQGRQLYGGNAHHQAAVTSLAWAPSGAYFALGTYNGIRLCDSAGWSHAWNKAETGSLYSIAWSQDGTRIAAACANGHVLFGNIIEKELCKYSYNIVLTTASTLSVSSIIDTTINEMLEFTDRVTNFDINSEHLLVTTPTQCHIYKIDDFISPTVVELKDGCGASIQMTENHFALIEHATVSVYSYTGRQLFNHRWPGIQPQQINNKSVSLGADLIIIRDHSDQKAIHMFELSRSPMTHQTNAQGTILKHSVPVHKMCVSQAKTDTAIAVLDSNHDLFIVPYGENKFYKMGMQAVDIIWSSEANVLAAVQESRISVWYCPLECSASIILLSNTSSEHDIAQFGARPTLISFDGAIISIQRTDGAFVSLSLQLHYFVLHGFVANKQWDKSLRLCRLIKDRIAWWCLAAMACYQKELQICLQAFAATQTVDRVAFIDYIKELPSGPQQIAEFLLLIGRQSEAESVLLHSGNIVQAVALCVKMHNWDKALDLAIKYKLDLVNLLSKRQEYLTAFNKIETNEKYLQAVSSIEIN